MKLHKKKNLPLKLHICTHTCFLLDKMHIKPPFKNAKDLTFKKIIWMQFYKITTCTWVDVKKNHCYMCMILLSQLFFNYSEYVQYDIAIEFTVKEILICQNFTTILSEVFVLIKKDWGVKILCLAQSRFCLNTQKSQV